MWISWTTDDALITSLIVDAESIINSIFNVDTFAEWAKTEQLKFNPLEQVYYLKNMPVTAITKINWIAYTWIKWTDYMIVRSRQAIIRTSFSPYFINLKFDFFEMEYTAWYAIIPDWLKAMTKFLVAWIYNQRKVIWVSQYALWDENITFRNDSEFSQFKNLYNSHKKINLWF